MRAGSQHVVELAAEPAKSLEELADLAQDWGAEWTQDGIAGGQLALPVRAGLRRGLVEGPVSIAATRGGSRLTFDVEDSFYRVQYSAFFLVLLGAMAGIFTMFVPLVPDLLPLALPAVFVAIAAWLLIITRLKNAGPEEFFDVLAAVCEPETPGED